MKLTKPGIRPLVKDPNAKNTESLVRSHLVTVSPTGLLTCAGGKWTTYRQMAEDAVDEAIKTFNLTPKTVSLPDLSGAGLPGLTTTGKCCTLTTPLIGAHGWSDNLAQQLTQTYGTDNDIAAHLASNYGDRAWAVLSTPGATTRLLPAYPFVEAELRHGVHQEAACTASDLISRRTRLAFLDVDSALKVLPRVIDVMAEELSWDEKRKTHEWGQTVHFLRSMGLSNERLDVSRQEVEQEASRGVMVPRELLPSGGGGSGGLIDSGLGDQTIAARTSESN